MKGPEIPLGAKIIKVCDAIDAMLSDRPYRSALTLEAVRSQLVQYAGIQFDLRVTNIVTSSTILERHAAEVALHHGRIMGPQRPRATVGTSAADRPPLSLSL